MKKIFGFFFLLSIALSVFIYATEVKDGYLYGDLAIAYNNELPSGLFAKSRNYLPGDTLRITNPFTGEEINVLNLSSLDEDSETVLMLTTEAANKLGIDVKNPLYVRISPRTNDFDEIAAGSAMLTYNKNSVPTAAVPEVASSPKTESETPAPVKEAAEPAPVAESPAPKEEEQKPLVTSAPPVPKEEPVANLSTLSEEPPVASVKKTEVPKVPEKMEEPIAEKEQAAPAPVPDAKKEEPLEFAEETTVRSSDGKKTYTTVTKVSKTVVGTPADPDKVEEIAVRNKKDKKNKETPKAQEKQDVYEEQVLPAPAKKELADKDSIPDKKDDPVYEEIAPLPSPANDAVASVSEAAPSAVEELVEAPKDTGSMGDVIPMITEESVKLASNGLKEVPSATLPVEEFPLDTLHTGASKNDAVYEYSQPHGNAVPQKKGDSSGLVQEIPVSFSPVRNKASESSPKAVEIPVAPPKKQLPAAPAESVLETAFKDAKEAPKAVQPELPAPKKEEEKPLPPVQNVSLLKDEPVLPPPDIPVAKDVEEPQEEKTRVVTDVPMMTEAPKVEESPTAVETPVRAELPGKSESPKAAEAPKLTESPKITDKKADSPKITETPVRAEVPKKANSPVIAESPVKAEPQKKTEPKKTEPQKKADTAPKTEPKKNVPSKKTEPVAKAETGKKQQTAVQAKEKEAAKKTEAKQVAAKPAQETKEQEAETELVYSQKDELMLVPSGGKSQSYDGASQKTASNGKDEKASEDADDSDIIVNKQDVLTLSPTDSISPDGQSKEGQKAYTPQKVEPKKDDKVPAKTGSATAKASDKAPAKTGTATTKTSDKAPAGTGKAVPQTASAVREKDLKAGNYVQFATCTTDAEAEKILSKYKKYPIIKVLFETRAGYKLLVGPLNDDEKGAVLTRFKAFGYKDAYVRTIK